MTSTALGKLIRACVDDERTLHHERNFVDAGRAGILLRLAREREQFVEDLERVGGRVQRRPSGSSVELLREAGRTLFVAAAGRNHGDAVASCRHSHARTEARYDRAMLKPWPDPVARLLAAQVSLLREGTDELNQLQF